MESGLIAARFVHIAALAMAFGAALFPFYVYGDPRSWPDGTRLGKLHIAAAIVALLSAFAWLYFTAVAITDDTSFGAVWMVLRLTAFGTLWLGRLVLAVFVVTLALLPLRRWAAWTELVFLAMLLASLAQTGHALTGGEIHIVADALHLLAAGAWIGGLLPLGFALAEQEDATSTLHRFSAMGLTAVAVLIASGLVNGLFLVGTPWALVTTTYGHILLIKLALFVLMLALAARNRFVLMPRMSNGDNTAHSMLLRAVVAEQSLGLLVLMLVAVLGTLEPAIEAVT